MSNIINLNDLQRTAVYVRSNYRIYDYAKISLDKENPRILLTNDMEEYGDGKIAYRNYCFYFMTEEEMDNVDACDSGEREADIEIEGYLCFGYDINHDFVEGCDMNDGDIYTAAVAVSKMDDFATSMFYVDNYTAKEPFINLSLVAAAVRVLPEYIYKHENVYLDSIALIPDPQDYSVVSFPLGIPDFFESVKVDKCSVRCYITE